MKRRRVVKRTCIASPAPILHSLFAWLVLEHFAPAGWVWGVVGTVVALLWIGFITTLFTEDYRDPFEDIDKRR